MSKRGTTLSSPSSTNPLISPDIMDSPTPGSVVETDDRMELESEEKTGKKGSGEQIAAAEFEFENEAEAEAAVGDPEALDR